MKTPFILILSFILGILQANAQNKFWEPKPGLPGGRPSGIVQVQATDTLLASISPKMIYKSEDGGDTWSLIVRPETIPAGVETVYATINGTLYGQVYNPDGTYGVYRSGDFGMTWNQITNNTNIRDWQESLNGNYFGIKHLSSTDRSVVKSTDNGASWQVISEEDGFGIDHNGNIQILSSNYLLVSQDEANTWDTILYTGNAQTSTLILPSGKYLMTTSEGVATGTLGENNFQVTLPGQNGFVSNPVLLNDGRILVGHHSKLKISDDEGQTWENWSNFYPLNGIFLLPHQIPDGKIFANWKSSLYASTDEGLTFNPSSTGMRNCFFSDIQKSTATNTLWGLSNDGLYSSHDDGNNWSLITGSWQNTPYSIRTFIVANDGTLYFYVFGVGFYASYDGGTTLIDLTIPEEDIHYSPKLCIMPSANTLLYNGQLGMYKLNIGDTNWVKILDAPASTDFNFPVIEHPNGDWYATNYASFLKSSDNGASWESIDFSAFNYDKIIGIEQDGTFYTKRLDGTFHFTQDLTGTWTEIPLPSGVQAETFNVTKNGYIYVTDVINNKTTLFRSANKGVSWGSVPELPETFYQQYPKSLLIDEEGYLFLTLYLESKPYILAKSAFPVNNATHLLGNAASSDDANCTTFDPVAPLKNIIIEADGENTWYTITNTMEGNYQMYLDTGTYTVRPHLPLPFLWDTCAAMVNLPIVGDTAYADFSVPALVECPFVTVELAVPNLERCFTQNIYIDYCNHGSANADSAVLFLELDPFLSINNPSQPWALVDTANINLPCYPGGLDSNAVAWYLPIGALEITECGQITVPILVSCDAEPGQTHCITAYSCPDELCINSQNWSGANIEVDALCVGDSVQLSVRNSGSSPSQLLNFVVVEDDVVLMSGDDDYQPNEVATYSFPANGEYFRIESEQEPGHPFPQAIAAWKVGCNGDPLPSSMFINQFPTFGGYASEDTDCQINTGSFDPNDKQGMPLGFGNDHLIKRGVDIEYLIRFQNTGTAPAHNVVLRDTLSTFLDPGSIRVGAGSHPFTWTLTGEGILVFSFENINLPDSSANEPASHGFVSFKIAQRPNLPIGTDIFNSAAIYFDFNPPVITNTTHHRIGEDFLDILNASQQFNTPIIALTASPNPTNDQTILDGNGAATLWLYNAQGILAKTMKPRNDGQFLIKRDGLPSGIYWMTTTDSNGNLMGSGRLVFR